jgi:hypothetical protein
VGEFLDSQADCSCGKIRSWRGVPILCVFGATVLDLRRKLLSFDAAFPRFRLLQRAVAHLISGLPSHGRRFAVPASFGGGKKSSRCAKVRSATAVAGRLLRGLRRRVRGASGSQAQRQTARTAQHGDDCDRRKQHCDSLIHARLQDRFHSSAARELLHRFSHEAVALNSISLFKCAFQNCRRPRSHPLPLSAVSVASTVLSRATIDCCGFSPTILCRMIPSGSITI